jgi:metal-dependent amidase/aminoacylase/carboxypeptidase family protein
MEIEYRNKLRTEGKISFLGGKQELLALGEFADTDLSMMCHLGSSPDKRCTVGGSSNGFVGKLIRYIGKEAHAGGAPHRGINALNAAMIGLMAINANRETFQDDDHIRVHPIMTRGGDLVNIIPADVRMETYVRGKSMDAIIDANAKVSRALQAGAMAVGAEVEITDIPGYLPRLNDQTFSDTFRDNVAPLIGGEQYVGQEGHGAGSTDMGDLSHVMPALHPHIGGVEGAGHSENYRIVDENLAYIVPAKAMAMTVIDLLWDGADLAKQITAGYTPVYTRESYLAMWEQLLGNK